MWSLWTKTGRDHRINVHDLLKWWDSNHVCCYFMICMTNFLKEYLLQITEEAYRNISTLNPWSKGPTYKEPLEWGIEVVGYRANPGFVGPEGYIICWYLLRKNIKTTENPIQMRTPCFNFFSFKANHPQTALKMGFRRLKEMEWRKALVL